MREIHRICKGLINTVRISPYGWINMWSMRNYDSSHKFTHIGLDSSFSLGNTPYPFVLVSHNSSVIVQLEAARVSTSIHGFAKTCLALALSQYNTDDSINWWLLGNKLPAALLRRYNTHRWVYTRTHTRHGDWLHLVCCTIWYTCESESTWKTWQSKDEEKPREAHVRTE